MSARWKLVSNAALGTVALVLATPVAAQTVQSSDEESAGDTGQIVVTGSRIIQPGLKSNSPITAVDSAEIRLQGATNIESVLNRLPQVTPDANDNVSNGSDGTARINLRNLGSQRNLVLVNGQRLLPVQANDINFIPAALVQRIDVVTGGASAVYGSDAISGVVNFIMRDNLNGVLLDTQYGFAAHHNNNDARRSLISGAGFQNATSSPVDGQRFDFNVAFGSNLNDGRGNVTAYFGYRRVQPINQSARDVSACALDINTARDGYVCGGSSNNEYGFFQPTSGPGIGRALNNTRDGNKTWVPYDSTFRYNYAPLNFFQRDDERFTAGAFAKYEVTSAAEVYGSFMFMQDHTFSQVAPSALWQGDRYAINCDNPLMSQQQGQILCGSALGTPVSQSVFIGYRPVAGNAQPRINDIRLNDLRLTGGIRGEIAEGIRYDANILHSQVLRNETYQNDIDPNRARLAIQVVDVAGTPTCKSVVDGSDPNCVPLDVFRYNGISDAAFDYIYVPSSLRGIDKQTVLMGTVSGDLTPYGIKLPWAEQGIGFVVGVEHRRESLEFRADAVALSKGTRESEGEFDVTEGFAEIRVPIASDRPFFYDLSVTGGYRFSKYSSMDDGVSTYKGEISWAPSTDLRLRGSYNRAVRAPNVSELFGPQYIGNVSAQDPCAGATPTASLAACALSGVTAAQYGNIVECPANQCSAQFGGNPALRPERADTYTAGAVITPGFIPRLSLSVDYFNIKVNEYINTISTAQTINECFSTGNPYFCDLIRRDPTNGVMFGVNGFTQETTQNTGSLHTSGIDVGLDYSIRTGIGRFAVAMTGTWLEKLVTEPLPGLDSYDCKGLFGPVCGQPQPEWRHQARLSWTDASDFATFSLNWRYLGSTSLTSNTDDPSLNPAAGTPAFVPHTISDRISAYNYFDLAATAKVQEGIVLRMGVNNLFDKDPPAIGQGLLAVFGNGNTYPGVYDVLGRSFFFGVNASF